MNVKNEAEAAQFPEKEYINRISVAVRPGSRPRGPCPHCKENPICIFLFWYLWGLSPNFHIHVSVSDFIYSQDLSTYFPAAEYADWSWKYKNFSQTHECGNWYWGHTIPRKGIQNGIFLAVHLEAGILSGCPSPRPPASSWTHCQSVGRTEGTDSSLKPSWLTV